MKFDLQQLPAARLDFIKPILARSTDRLPDGPTWLYELKLDGYRALAMEKRGAAPTNDNAEDTESRRDRSEEL